MSLSEGDFTFLIHHEAMRNRRHESLGSFFAHFGWLFMLGLAVYHASQFGTRWEFGRYGMPRTLVDASGSAHPDGTLIDPITQMTIRAGIEEEVMLVICVILAVILTLLVLAVRKGIVLRKRLAALRAKSERWDLQRVRR